MQWIPFLSFSFIFFGIMFIYYSLTKNDNKNINQNKYDNTDYSSLLAEFKSLVDVNFSLELVEFIRKRSIEELIWLQFKCKKGGVDYMVDPERVLHALDNEINRRMHIETSKISNIIAFMAVIAAIISIITLLIK